MWFQALQLFYKYLVYTLHSESLPYDLEEIEVAATEHVKDTQLESNLLSLPNPTVRRKHKHPAPPSRVWGLLEAANGKLVIVDNIE